MKKYVKRTSFSSFKIDLYEKKGNKDDSLKKIKLFRIDL
jgi:hypothetical protein